MMSNFLPSNQSYLELLGEQRTAVKREETKASLGPSKALMETVREMIKIK